MPLQGGNGMAQNFFSTGNSSKINPGNLLVNQTKSSLDFLFEDNYDEERRLNTNMQSRLGVNFSQDDSRESNMQLCAALGNLIQ